MNPNKHAMTPADRRTRARIIAKSLGTKFGAAYLRSRGVSLCGAMFTLLGPVAFRRAVARERVKKC